MVGARVVVRVEVMVTERTNMSYDGDDDDLVVVGCRESYL